MGANPKQKCMSTLRMAGGGANAKELMQVIGQEVIDGKLDSDDKKALTKRRNDLLEAISLADKAKVEVAAREATAATAKADDKGEHGDVDSTVVLSVGHALPQGQQSDADLGDDSLDDGSDSSSDTSSEDLGSVASSD